MRDLPCHQEAKRVRDAGIVAKIDEALVDDLAARLGGDVRPIIDGFGPGFDMGAVHRTPAELVRATPRDLAIIAGMQRIGLSVPLSVRRCVKIGW